MKETLNTTEKSAAMPTVGSPTPALTYKDRIFRMIFKEKREFLDLYNAMNGTHYTNPDELTVTTLDNAIYLGMKTTSPFYSTTHFPCTSTSPPTTRTCRSGIFCMYPTYIPG